MACRAHLQRGPRSDSALALQVSINNASLPELPARLPEGMRADPARVSTACGHLVLYLRLFASVLWAPLLHESGYMGSSSAVWQPGSFWAASAPLGPRLQLWHTPSQLPFWPQAEHALDSQQLSRCAFLCIIVIPMRMRSHHMHTTAASQP